MADSCLDMSNEHRLQGRYMKQIMCAQHRKLCSSCNGYDEYEEKCPHYEDIRREIEMRRLHNGQGQTKSN